MKTKTILGPAAVAVALCVTPAFAQKGVKEGGRFGNLFAPEVYAVESAVEAVLLLTDEQRTKLVAALTTTIQAPALAELGAKLKKGAPDFQAAAERYQAERARAQDE